MKVEARTGRAVRFATLTMVVMATFAIELAMAEPGHPPLATLGSAAGFLVAPMLVLSLWLGQRKLRKSDTVVRQNFSRAAEVAAIVFLIVLPFAVQPLMRVWTDKGFPLEAILMASLRNLSLGLAALAHRPTLAKLAALVSLFQAMIASSMGDGPTVILAVGAYSVVGVLWLMFAYWEGLSHSTIEGRRSRPPAFAMVAWASAFAGVVIVAVAVGPSRAATILAGLVPSSGGTGDNDPDARGGVNDGDNEVAASKDPKSIGFTESEVYLESDRPSLYDSFSEQYGEPIKPKNKQERMVAMGPQETEAKDRPTENLHAGRTFPTVRLRPGRETGRGAERQAKALVYVKGQTPLHLALAAYDRFDGVTWEEEPHSGQHCPLELVPDQGAWLRLDLPTARPFAGLVSHQIKIGTLDSSPLPVPAHVTRLRVGSVNRPDFFGWAQLGLLRMVERTVPAGTVIDTESRTLDPSRLRSIEFESAGLSASRRYQGVPESLDPGVERLVHSWSDGVPRGWSQVEAVVAGVRSHCLHDRLATVPEDARDVVGHFLLRSRCGPDHHFASATAVSLRLLGYQSRVVSGYYAAPGRYDARTRHTPVTGEDVHFWVEVLLPSGTWAAVEPTPGYEMMGPALSIGEQAIEALRLACRRVRSNAPAIALGLVALGLTIGLRRQILDRISTVSWWLLARGPGRDLAFRTLRLIELRMSRAGLRRPTGRTPARWYRSIAADAPAESQAEMERLLTIAGWASYAPQSPGRKAPWSESDIALTCQRVVQNWTLGRFASHRRSLISEGTHS